MHLPIASPTAAVSAGRVHDNLSTNDVGGESKVDLAGFEVEASMHGMQHIAESELYGGLRCDKVQCGFLRLSPCERSGKNNQNMEN